MSDANRDALKSMLNNLINDRAEEAQLDFHNYVTGKMKSVSGISSAADEEVPVEDILDTDDEALPDELE